MGQAFDRDGSVLGEAFAATKREVFDTLTERYPAADEIRIKTRIKTLYDQIEAGPVPSIGRIVHYRLNADDAAQINRRRTTGKSIADRMKDGVPLHESITAWPTGAQAHIGNEAKEGDVFPMLIVRVWGPTATSAVNGQVFLDGNDVFWATSRIVGDGPGTFAWPTRT